MVMVSGGLRPRETRSLKGESQSSYDSLLPRVMERRTLAPEERMAQETKIPSFRPACYLSDS